jgi:hypothetical protein
MKLLRRIRALFQQPRLDREMAEEMRGHVELAVCPSSDEQQSNRGAVGGVTRKL